MAIVHETMPFRHLITKQRTYNKHKYLYIFCMYFVYVQLIQNTIIHLYKHFLRGFILIRYTEHCD